MEMKLKKFAPYIFTIAFIIVSFAIQAQVPGGGGVPGGSNPGGSGCFPNPCVPIDGGISFLVAAGVALGGKKLFDASKK
jgi:hypothetical protein